MGLCKQYLYILGYSGVITIFVSFQILRLLHDDYLLFAQSMNLTSFQGN